jgi:hypothetical protein
MKYKIRTRRIWTRNLFRTVRRPQVRRFPRVRQVALRREMSFSRLQRYELAAIQHCPIAVVHFWTYL